MASSLPHTQPPAILIVEDEAFVRIDLGGAIEGEGYKVYEAASADEAILLMEAHPDIRVLFTEIDMPGSMDGIKLSHYVRNRWPPVKIFVSSALRTPTADEMPSGSVFISKPYRIADMQLIFEAARASFQA